MTEKDRIIAELYAKNTRLERESTERVQKSTALLRKRINELTEANISLRKENEYLNRIVDAAATLGEPFLKAAFEAVGYE